jgi:hypothetical protein
MQHRIVGCASPAEKVCCLQRQSVQASERANHTERLTQRRTQLARAMCKFCRKTFIAPNPISFSVRLPAKKAYRERKTELT